MGRLWRRVNWWAFLVTFLVLALLAKTVARELWDPMRPTEPVPADEIRE